MDTTETIEPRDGCDSVVTTNKTPAHIKFIFIVSIIIIILVIAIVIVTVLSNKSKKTASTTSTDTVLKNDNNDNNDLNDLKRKRKERREKLDKMNKNIETEEQAEHNLKSSDDVDDVDEVPQKSIEKTDSLIASSNDAIDDDAPVLHSDSNIQVEHQATSQVVHEPTENETANTITHDVSDDEEDLINNFMLNNVKEDSQ